MNRKIADVSRYIYVRVYYKVTTSKCTFFINKRRCDNGFNSLKKHVSMHYLVTITSTSYKNYIVLTTTQKKGIRDILKPPSIH